MSLTFIISPHHPKCCVYISLPSRKKENRNSYERKSFVVAKMELVKWKNRYKLTRFVAAKIRKSSVRKTRDTCM
jgi:hypothetical protein